MRTRGGQISQRAGVGADQRAQLHLGERDRHSTTSKTKRKGAGGGKWNNGVAQEMLNISEGGYVLEGRSKDRDKTRNSAIMAHNPGDKHSVRLSAAQGKAAPDVLYLPREQSWHGETARRGCCLP